MGEKKATTAKSKSSGLIAQVRAVWLFFTRLPFPLDFRPGAKKTAPPPLGSAARFFPLAGLVIGGLGALALWLGAKAGLHPMAASTLGLAVVALASGAMHEDGLADVADGFGGGSNKTRKLEIMRDSSIGTYGALALVLVTLLKIGALGGAPGPGYAAAIFVAAHVLSRGGLALMMVAMKPARRDGLGKKAGTPTREDAVISAIIATLIAVLILGIGPGIAAAALAGLGIAGVGWLSKRHIKGITGDVLGAAQQVAEVLVFLGAVVVLSRTAF